MRFRYLVLSISAAILVAGCESGDINIAPSTNTSNSNNTTTTGGGGTTNPCASYMNTGGQVLQGVYDGTDCTYPPSFLDEGKNLLVDMTIPKLDNGGAHIFQGSVFVGRTYNNTADMNAAGIFKGGDGPKLTIEAGTTIAFASEDKFITINRGSQIFAVGTASDPITFTSTSDLDGTVGPEDVRQWGGIVILGFGVTNQCDYTGTRGAAGFASASDCSVQVEGTSGINEAFYGGDNDADSSGRIEYVVLKHSGNEVGTGDELNGFTFGAVGSNTIVNNIEMYSVYDDGAEFFGGAVSVDNYVAVYARDDSIDLDAGWQGKFTNVLIIQSATDGNNCIESDGLASYSSLTDAVRDDFIARNLNTHAEFDKFTCIWSPNGGATATHTPGAGVLFREGIQVNMTDALIIGSFNANDQASANDNYCIDVRDSQTQTLAENGTSTMASVIFSCAELDGSGGTFPGGVLTSSTWATSQGVIFGTVADGTAVSATAANGPGLQLLEGTPPIYSIDYATSLVDGVAPAAGNAPQSGTFLGSLSLGIPDWAVGWTYGLVDGARGEPLWFEGL